MALLLLAQALLEQPAQLVEVERLEQLALLVGELAPRRVVGEPVEQLLGDLQRLDLDALEVRGERDVERVEVLLAVHQERARDVVEAVERGVVQAARQRLATASASCAPTFTSRSRSS